MTLAFVALWTLATLLMALGWIVPALVVAGVAVLFGARWWLHKQASKALVLSKPIRVD